MKIPTVLTLNEGDFSDACAQLASEIEASGSFDLVIGIITGGAVVRKEMVSRNAFASAVHIDLKCQRAGTVVKKKFPLKAVFKFFPRRVLDALRVTEHLLREKRHTKVMKAGIVEHKRIDVAAVDIRQISGAKNILIVDDAVDSGRSMRAAVDFVKSINSSASISTACIVKTFNQPLIAVDYTLFSGLLVRFPWSEDAK